MKIIKLDYLVYAGDFFQVEFYYSMEGCIEIWNDFMALDENNKRAFFLRIEKIANSKPGCIHPRTIFNLEDAKEKIWAIKFGNNRFCSFFYQGRKIIITNSYKKQSQQNRKKEKNQIKKAVQLKQDYELRVKNKIYYIE